MLTIERGDNMTDEAFLHLTEKAREFAVEAGLSCCINSQQKVTPLYRRWFWGAVGLDYGKISQRIILKEKE